MKLAREQVPFLRLGRASGVHPAVRPWLPGGERYPQKNTREWARLAEAVPVVRLGWTCKLGGATVLTEAGSHERLGGAGGCEANAQGAAAVVGRAGGFPCLGSSTRAYSPLRCKHASTKLAASCLLTLPPLSLAPPALA